jgi:hypothetical protein
VRSGKLSKVAVVGVGVARMPAQVQRPNARLTMLASLKG